MNRYGVCWMPTWPHISLGISAHLSRKFGHLSLHLPIGVVVLGFIGASPGLMEADERILARNFALIVWKPGEN